MSAFVSSRVKEYHIDGFRFDLASVLCRGPDGSPLDAPPLIKVLLAISSLQWFFSFSCHFCAFLVR
jgi:hypothetical protein